MEEEGRPRSAERFRSRAGSVSLLGLRRSASATALIEYGDDTIYSSSRLGRHSRGRSLGVYSSDGILDQRCRRSSRDRSRSRGFMEFTVLRDPRPPAYTRPVMEKPKLERKKENAKDKTKDEKEEWNLKLKLEETYERREQEREQSPVVPTAISSMIEGGMSATRLTTLDIFKTSAGNEKTGMQEQEVADDIPDRERFRSLSHGHEGAPSSTDKDELSSESQPGTLTAEYNSLRSTGAGCENQADLEKAIEGFMQGSGVETSSEGGWKSEKLSSHRFAGRELSGSSDDSSSSLKSPGRLLGDRASRTEDDASQENDEHVEAVKKELHRYQGSSISNTILSSIQWLCLNIRRFLRPNVVSGYRRIEWTCVRSP